MSQKQTVLHDAYRGKHVFVTGHTGFKGAWLCEWLLMLGAKVTGFSLAPSTSPALFDQLNLAKRVNHQIGDIRDFNNFASIFKQSGSPDFVFHLAAQPLVRISYDKAVDTYATNVMGTTHVLDVLRSSKNKCAAIFITTDKCYQNSGLSRAYEETDPLGGHDPYSSSKAAAELVIAAYRNSFFSKGPVKVASVRAGNVIGGGDWAIDRIVPDCVRALERGEPIPIRNKSATRPWQHVLEPLSGYLWLGAVLANPKLVTKSKPEELANAFNFGPELSSNKTVQQLVEEILKHRPGKWINKTDPNAVHEANLLNLSSKKAKKLLRWKPIWNFQQTIAETISWYLEREKKSDSIALTQNQIQKYIQQAQKLRVAWAKAT